MADGLLGDHNARDFYQSTSLAARPWRQGRKVGRNIYAQVSNDPSDDDVAIGSFDSEWLAFACVQAHNAEVVYHPASAEHIDGLVAPDNAEA